jgi:hypothetical protein
MRERLGSDAIHRLVDARDECITEPGVLVVPSRASANSAIAASRRTMEVTCEL